MAGNYRGTLGSHRITLELHGVPDAEDSYEGTYQADGDATVVQLAGESEGQSLSMEESRNGTDVSGSWVGTVEGASIQGTWTDVDERQTLHFELTRQGSK